MLLIAGLSAGAIATLVQLVLWWLAEVPVSEALFRDVRLTAALMMVPGVLPPPSTAQWGIFLVATIVHFVLSILYAFFPASLVGHLRGWGLWFQEPCWPTNMPLLNAGGKFIPSEDASPSEAVCGPGA